MSEINIGSNIAALRKEKGVTQETLGDVVGLTAQAVSKWESGGSPDTALLPVIADYFDVSIDRLYGRKSHDSSNFIESLREHIASLPSGERLEALFELLFGSMFTLMEIPQEIDVDLSSFGAMMEKAREMGAAAAHMITPEGLVKAGLRKPLAYFIVMPEPDNGWGHKLHYKEEYSRLFTLLGDDDTLKSIFFLTSRINKHFTPKLLAGEFGFSLGKAEKILENLVQYELIKSKELEVDNEITTIYEYHPNMSLIPFFTFAEDIIKPPKEVCFHVDNRENIPYITRKEKTN